MITILFKTSTVLFTCALSLSVIVAQESVNTTGGNASGSGGFVSYSVGQISCYTNIGTSGSVIEGVQIPYEISVVTEIEETKGISLSVSAYPNPVNDNLVLAVDNFKLSTLNFQLIDMNGKILQIDEIKSSQTNIDMSNLLPSAYFIRITQNNREIKAFKIIKN